VLKDNLVQQLAAQVDDMMDVQAAVADQLSSMEERLERMHAPLQERLRIYEQRISELEGELAQRGQENQLLLRARIEALRWQMEQERSGAGVN
jgi:predicted RNase H-like nuclease (RuvC/YqgF family)